MLSLLSLWLREENVVDDDDDDDEGEDDILGGVKCTIFVLDDFNFSYHKVKYRN